MKKKKFWVILLAAIATVMLIGGLCACTQEDDEPKDSYVISLDMSKSLELEIDEEVDYKQYFTVMDYNGNRIVVTDAMLDTSKADTSKEGQFTVTLAVGDASRTLTFTVKQKEDNATENLSEIFAKYADSSKWNFSDAVSCNGAASDDYYEYYGDNILNRYEYDGVVYNDYLSYVASSDAFYFYYDNGDGTYDKFDEDSDDFNECWSAMAILDLSQIGNFDFTKTDNGYVAVKPGEVGNAVLGEYTDYTWTSVTVFVANGYITKIIGVMDDGYTYQHELGNYGSVHFTLPKVESSTTTPVTPTDTMEKQTYNAATFDDNRLQAKLITAGDEPDFAIGLPSKGTFHALVIPVKFSNTSIDSGDLSNLNIAFNGTEEQTGWESVKTYYHKASYGNLNLSFDIAGYNIDGVSYFTSSRNSSYYESHTATENGQKYNDGDNVLLHEVLKYYETKLDLTKYDTNDDGVIDAVYLIYSAPVDYDSDDSFYWAYVTWNYEEKTYDGLDTYYYLFAGFDFMNESVRGKDTNSGYSVIDGLKVNASTYIHETGHLLGLDDYYDYYPSDGSNEGLGGADMMDYTVGDQNVYSKTMLGWITPEIVTTTKTVTIGSSQATGDAILIPLKFNNSYFCEYLLIDLYSAQGLNQLHSSSLYGGASFGVRIYHVSSSINNPYSDEDYSSFTDYNNSTSEFALIKLVEADGETKFKSTDGEAAAKDLWKAGSSLSKVFPKYTRNDGKLLNFDITINSVSATEASITITYNV